MSELKKQGINISVSTVATLLPVLAVVWFFVQPALVTAIAADLDKMIVEKQEPIQNAFASLLSSEIRKLKRLIAELEFKQQHRPDMWTADDAELLADCRIELEDLQNAKEALNGS